MKQIICLVLGLVTLVLVLSCQSNKRANNYNDKASADDSVSLFLKNSTEESLMAVKASGLAISNSKNQRVIQFAKTMIDDHTRLTDELKELQADDSVKVTDTLNAFHQQIIADLEQKKAAEFDKAYLEIIIAQHEQEMNHFKAAAQVKNLNVVEFAQKGISLLQAHLDSAKTISDNLK
jgi:putative membrane protein